MSPFTLQSCATPAPSTLAYFSMLRDISRASLDSSSATYTAPFLNPLTTAKAALYFSCCRRWLTVYRMVFTSSGPAMVRSAVPDTTLMSVAHTYRSVVSHWIRAVLTSKSGSYVSLALVRVFEMKCISFLFVCLFKVYCKWFQAEASTQSLNSLFNQNLSYECSLYEWSDISEALHSNVWLFFKNTNKWLISHLTQEIMSIWN